MNVQSGTAHIKHTPHKHISPLCASKYSTFASPVRALPVVLVFPCKFSASNYFNNSLTDVEFFSNCTVHVKRAQKTRRITVKFGRIIWIVFFSFKCSVMIKKNSLSLTTTATLMGLECGTSSTLAWFTDGAVLKEY